LPAGDEVGRVVATGYYGPLGELVEFDVPVEHWPRIRAALGRPTRDRHPAKWIKTGSLEVTTRAGQALHVSLYDTKKLPGAFSAGPTFERRVYYRGGDSDELARAMATAYEDARDRGHVRTLSP
jgi:hypothetical protein